MLRLNKQYGLIILLLIMSLGHSQSFMLESGVAYGEHLLDKTATQDYDVFSKLGVRAIIPISESLGIYADAFLKGDWGFGAGLWIDFPGQIQDLEGLNTFAALGLGIVPSLNTSTTQDSSYIQSVGATVMVGVSYDISDNLALMGSYTHHPIFSPTFSQAFDLSFGLRWMFNQ